MPNYMLKTDVCESLRISLDTLERLIATGEVEAYKVGRGVRIPESAIEAYMRKNTMGQKGGEDA